MNIIEEIGTAAMLEQLAEECNELGKAALKLARIMEALNKSARAGSDRFFVRQKNGKRRNTVCISRFSFCMDGKKDSLSSRRQFIQSFLIRKTIQRPSQKNKQKKTCVKRQEMSSLA